MSFTNRPGFVAYEAYSTLKGNRNAQKDPTGKTVPKSIRFTPAMLADVEIILSEDRWPRRRTLADVVSAALGAKAASITEATTKKPRSAAR